MYQHGLGWLAAAGIAWVSFRRGWLTAGGAAGATLIGAAVFGSGGLAWAIPLIVFFLSSSWLTRWGRRLKFQAESEYQKSGARDLGQVLANGGPAALVALIAPWAGADLFPLYLGLLAAVTADTWATEIGGLSKTPPRLITSLRPVPPGTSGGITPIGLAASAAGGTLIGLIGSLPLAGLLGGLAGSLIDSLLGATVQARYLCPACAKITERRAHGCGAVTLPSGGLGWMDNDMVNLTSSVLGSGVGWAASLIN